MSGENFTLGKMLAIFISLILLSFVCFGLAMIEKRGLWPADWPKELEPYRQQAKTISVAAGNQEDVFEISFRSREQFEKICPIILSLKSESASLTLNSAGSLDKTGLFDYNEPLVRIFAPAYSCHSVTFPDVNLIPLIPHPPWPKSAYLPNDVLPKYVRVSDDKKTWVPVNANFNPEKSSEFRANIEIELVIDGKIIDLNRIRLPADTPIIDKRIFPSATDVNK